MKCYQIVRLGPVLLMWGIVLTVAIPARSARRGREAELRKAEREMENIRQAVQLGKATVPLLEMLDEATAKVQRLRAKLSEASADVAGAMISDGAPTFWSRAGHRVRGGAK